MRAVFFVALTLSMVTVGCGVQSARESARSDAVETKSVTIAAAPQMTLESLALPETPPEHNTEAYSHIEENPFLAAKQNPLSTFSIDVDTAAYSNVRRFLNDGQLPPKDAVRIEELVNYFPYDYAPPTDSAPFSAKVEIGPCPWNRQHQLARIGLKGKDVPQERRGAANLVFLIDVSGSMNSPNKLPLLKQSLKLLVNQLGKDDRVAIVVYAGASGLVLPSTPCSEASSIVAALEQLQSGGSTNGGAGIQLAYSVAQQHFQQEGINRVILCTDGDFNVGVTSHGDLTRLIEEKREAGVMLTVLGFGMGNLKDSTLETLADKGNGNYAYIDTLLEARKVLVEQLGGTLITIAKDVKIQVDFNPAKVAAYRLIGYENRMLRNEDFHDDKKDAGEIGAGHCVTALYELVPPGVEIDLPKVDASKYQQPVVEGEPASGDEWLTLKLRYKEPTQGQSELLEFPITTSQPKLEDTSVDYRFASAVAAFGMLLRESQHKGDASYAMVLDLAQQSRGKDQHGYRHEFEQLVKLAQAMAPKQ